MMNWSKALFLGAALIAGPAAADPAPDPYPAMVAAIAGGQIDADYGALRSAYAQSAAYDPYGTKIQDLIPAMRKAFDAGDCTTAAKDAEAIGAIQFTELEAHMVAELCLKKEGNKTRADFHHAVFLGLAHSILHSGDGMAPETAYQVVTIEEEYAVLGLLELQTSGQALVRHDGHSYDRFTASMDDAKGEIEVFFNVDPLLNTLGRELQKP